MSEWSRPKQNRSFNLMDNLENRLQTDLSTPGPDQIFLFAVGSTWMLQSTVHTSGRVWLDAFLTGRCSLSPSFSQATINFIAQSLWVLLLEPLRAAPCGVWVFDKRCQRSAHGLKNLSLKQYLSPRS